MPSLQVIIVDAIIIILAYIILDWRYLKGVLMSFKKRPQHKVFS